MLQGFIDNKTITNREHIKNIKQMKNEIDQDFSPRCGNHLIEQEGKYGRYLRCSNYPTCKFKKKLNKNPF